MHLFANLNLNRYNMSQSHSNNPCEDITIFVITPEYLSGNESANRKICGICHEDLQAGDQAGRNGCCSALACLACLSRSANMRMPESRGGILPAYAKCQLCAELFDREPLNDRVPIVGEAGLVPDLNIASDGEQIDVKIQVTAMADDDTPNHEIRPEIWYEDEYVQVTKSNGVWTYSVGTTDVSIDEDFMQQDGTKLDLAGAMFWATSITRDLLTEPRVTKEEALARMSHYTFYEWMSSDEDE